MYKGAQHVHLHARVHDKHIKKKLTDTAKYCMSKKKKKHSEDIRPHLSPKSSLTRNTQEKKTQGQKVNQNNNPTWIY